MSKLLQDEDTPDASVFETVTKFLTGVKKPGEKYPSRPTDDDNYKMDHEKMGIAVIINQIDFSAHGNLLDRTGTEKDLGDLKDALELFGFTVQTHLNRTTSEIKNILKKVAKENHKDNNCLLIAVMSHGASKGVIYTQDFEMKVDEIWKPFTADKCPSLTGKPKIFLFQACRGNLPDVGAELEEEPCIDEANVSFASRSSKKFDTEKIMFVIPTVSDILIYFSSAEGFPSFRNDQGSWFVQALCATLRNCFVSQEETDIITLFTRINRFIAFARQANTDDRYNACKQMPVIESMLTKSIILNKKKEVN